MKLVLPTIEHKYDAIDYINELIEGGSAIHGTGFLERYLENSTYEKWLYDIDKLENILDNGGVPVSTYFLVDDDGNIIGMTNIRHKLNDKLFFHGGNIGYSIRPSLRRHGYGKVNLYLALEKCSALGIKRVLISAENNNIPSYRTIEALGGIMENKVFDKGKYFRRYWIDVESSLSLYKKYYG